MKTAEEAVREVLQEAGGTNWEELYRSAVKWQAAAQEDSVRAQTLRESIKAQVRAVQRHLTRLVEEVDREENTCSITYTLKRAMKGLAHVGELHTGLVEARSIGPNPFLLPLEGPERPEDGEEALPLNMEACEPQKAASAPPEGFIQVAAEALEMLPREDVPSKWAVEVPE